MAHTVNGSNLRILHLEDNVADAELIRREIAGAGFGFQIQWVDNKTAFVNALVDSTYALILADFTLPDFSGMSALQFAKKQCPMTPFIFVSGTIGEDHAIECLKAGATDYVLKHRLSGLGPSLSRALREAENRMEACRVQEALRKQAQLLDLANDSIVVRDLEARITYWNRGAEKLFGWTSEEVLTKHMHKLLRTEFPRPLKEIDETFFKNDHWEGEIVQTTRSNTRVSIASRWTLQRDPKGNPEAILEIGNDITERQRLEEQFLQSQKMESVGRLAGGLAHDFNNLLTVIIGRSYLLASRAGSDEKMRKDIDLIQKTADRAAGLTRQLLTFSRKQAIHPRMLDLNALVSHMDKMLHRLIGKDIDMLISRAADLGKVRADPGQIEQVIMNLVMNARDAMPDGGKITIETSNMNLDNSYASQHASVKPGPYVMLAVTDTGCGMDQETQSCMFEPFFTTRDWGTGLGLSTVYAIVKQSNGHLWVYSEPGVGTTLKVYLPLVAEKVEEAAANHANDANRGFRG